MDSPKHRLITDWMDRHQPRLRLAAAAKQLGVSVPYLSQVINGRKALSLKRADEWSRITGLPLEAFVQREAAE